MSEALEVIVAGNMEDWSTGPDVAVWKEALEAALRAMIKYSATPVSNLKYAGRPTKEQLSKLPPVAGDIYYFLFTIQTTAPQMGEK